MDSLRRLSLRHCRLAIWLVAAALMMKAFIPVGYMLDMADGTLLVRLCDGQSTQPTAKHSAAMAGAHAPGHHAMKAPGIGEHGDAGSHSKNGHKQAQSPCAFSGLSLPSLAAVDPVLLATAIAFIVAVIFRTAPVPFVSRGDYLRPPPRAPPARA